jgi:hypothetical protein
VFAHQSFSLERPHSAKQRPPGISGRSIVLQRQCAAPHATGSGAERSRAGPEPATIYGLYVP